MAVPYEMLLHPELLSNEKLIQIIQERHLRVQNLPNMSRSELLELFHQFCVPYGQRKHRDSGRGKILNKGRQVSPEKTIAMDICNRNINIIASCSKTSAPVNNSQNRKLCHLKEDCLRPAPDTLLGQMKRIKLDRSTPTKSSMKRKPSIDPVNISSSCSAPKKERKPITWP